MLHMHFCILMFLLCTTVMVCAIANLLQFTVFIGEYTVIDLIVSLLLGM